MIFIFSYLKDIYMALTNCNFNIIMFLYKKILLEVLMAIIFLVMQYFAKRFFRLVLGKGVRSFPQRNFPNTISSVTTSPNSNFPSR